MWWGYSSALDLLNECVLRSETTPDDGGTSSTAENVVSVNMLVVGQSDNRHVLKTLAKRYQHEEKFKVKLYVCEPLVENIARDLLLMLLALEKPENVGLAEKTKFFMELYGNTLIRPATSNYLISTAWQLINMITDPDYAKKSLPALSLKNLKFSEIDQLEIIFKYWTRKDDSFHILSLWDKRVREALGQRYDAMNGVFDWEYHMRYRSFGAETLNMQEYKRFREKGMAFYSEDTDPCIPNRTLASGITSTGLKITNFGYLGDIVTGPYPTFGFDCEDQRMLEKVNGYCKKTATDITENNIMRMLYEIVNQEPFLAAESQDEPYAIISQDTSHKLRIRCSTETDESTRRKCRSAYDFLPLHDCEISFMTIATLNKFLMKPEYENFFDVITFPQVLVLKYFKPDIVKLMKTNSKIVVDTPKYLLNFRKEGLMNYKSDLEKLMEDCNCKSLNSSFDYNSDEFMRFQVIKE